MKFYIGTIILTFFTHFAHANLLSRVQLEDAYKLKIESYVHLWDRNAKVLVRFEYKNFDSNLPGTSLSGSDELPDSVDLSNIKNATIQIFTNNPAISREAQPNIKKLIPIPAQNITLDLQNFSADMDLKQPVQLKKEDLKEISILSIETLIQKIIYLFGFLYFGTIMAFAFFHFQKLKEFRLHMGNLNETLLSNAATSTPVPQIESQPQKLLGYQQGGKSNNDESLSVGNIHAFSLEQLQAILSDCYWCMHDSEAAWIWRRLKLQAKAELIKMWPPLKEYSKYLQNIEENPTSLFEDIYYLSPPDIKHLDNDALAKILKTTPSIWGQLSNLRHKSIQLSLELSLLVRADAHTPTFIDFSLEEASPVRNFELTTMISELTSEEELKIEESPEIVPERFRKNVPTLCWLALKDPSEIKNILHQFDARSLASAWIGPEKTLQLLESQLSEKKLKALKGYLTDVKPSRRSNTFLQLHRFGVQDEAA